MKLPTIRTRPIRWIGVVALVLGLGFVATPANAALPGQSLGTDTLVTTREMIGWSTDANGFGWPGPVNSQFIVSRDGRVQFFAQTDSNLVVYVNDRATWALNLWRQGPGYIDHRPCADDFLLRSVQLRGPQIRLAHTSVFLVPQTDGNLVLYQGLSTFSTRNGLKLDTGRCAKWSSRTNWFFASDARLVIQNDGNLVLIVNGAPIWWLSQPNSGFIQVG